ncbi:hypothetical protein [Streptomyces sp. H39-S7]|uniref:hypothetical protein n=1 Tax=Streptomyces sp. H39-S7 TaxID=3004357 RepID=UPI0022AF2DB2|nr:hypothetical protein [Streptomyces sp. H39-S7]MCZ4118596.1 hypothetical protein [Streptomyces sp. H39-S7]
MPTPDLTVKDDLLAETEGRLDRLRREFDEGNISGRRDDLRHIWGSGAVADAMGDFVNNWDHYRKKLNSGIQSVGEMVSSTRETFKATDENLQKSMAGKG